MPDLREAAARAVVGDLEVAQAGFLQLADLEVKAAAAFLEVGVLLRVAKVDLVHDGQHRDLEQDGVQPRPLDADLELARGLGDDVDVLLVEPEQAQEVDEVALDEAHRAQVGEFGVAELQRAQAADLVADLSRELREVDARVAALEAVLDPRPRKVVQDHLHHRELVEVGVEQAVNDHGAVRGVSGLCRRRPFHYHGQRRPVPTRAGLHVLPAGGITHATLISRRRHVPPGHHSFSRRFA
ncbi:hypothetical protein D3C72_1612100 [compost metagenome]